jgi:thiamine pyridinylase
VEPTYDLVEVDTVLFADLQQKMLIQPFDPQTDTSDWHPAALAAVKSGNDLLGIPHLLCGHYIISRNPKAAAALRIHDLYAALTADGEETANIVGNFVGSWNMPALYLDAWRDTYPVRDPLTALTSPLHERARDALIEVKRLCDHKGGNRCLDGTFDYPLEDAPARLFAAGLADALLGYSERLHVVSTALQVAFPSRDDFQRELEKIAVGPAALGFGNAPIVFVDAFVLRAGTSPAVRSAGQRFAEFINRPEVQEALLMSADAPGALPRYLLPATQSAFQTPALQRDRFYPVLDKSLKDAIPYPSQGFPAARKRLQAAIRTVLEEDPSETLSVASDGPSGWPTAPILAAGVIVSLLAAFTSAILSLLSLRRPRDPRRAAPGDDPGRAGSRGSDPALVAHGVLQSEGVAPGNLPRRQREAPPPLSPGVRLPLQPPLARARSLPLRATPRGAGRAVPLPPTGG